VQESLPQNRVSRQQRRESQGVHEYRPHERSDYGAKDPRLYCYNNNNRRRKKKNSSIRSCIPAPSGNYLEDQAIKAVHEQQLMNLKIKKRPHSDTTTTYSMEADDRQQPVHHHQEEVRNRRHPKKMFVESTISSSTANRTSEANQFESDLLKIIRMLSCTRIHDSS
jgi:hypothetical protein